MKFAYQHLFEARARLNPIFQGKDGSLILQRIHEWTAREIEANLRVAFTEEVCAISLEVLANYLAGAQVALLHGWLAKRPSSLMDKLFLLAALMILSQTRSGWRQIVGL